MKPDFRNCGHCHTELPFTDKYFSSHSKKKFGLNTVCRTCQSKFASAWQRGAGKQNHKSYMRKYRTGFTQQEFDQKLAAVDHHPQLEEVVVHS